MPRVSAKRKAKSEIGRENIKKRWKKDDVSQHVVAELPASPDPPPPPSSTSFLQPPTQSAATFRHNLIPQQYREVQEVSTNSAMYNISHQRLSELLNLVSCGECGTKSTWEITPSYFDCTINVRCDSCESIVHHSQPEKCKNTSQTKGNVMHVYHSLCEGYGMAGLSRFSAGMGTKEMSAYTFSKYAEYIYNGMDQYYDEQNEMVRTCIEKLYEKEGIVKDTDGILNIDVSFDGTWLTRGHKSHIGAAFVIDIPSGLAVDFEVLSNFCRL